MVTIPYGVGTFYGVELLFVLTEEQCRIININTYNKLKGIDDEKANQTG